MATYIVNPDITHRLIIYLPLKIIVSLFTLNYSIYLLLLSTKLCEQLKLLKHRRNKLKVCYRKGLVTLLTKLYADNLNYVYPDAFYEAATHDQLKTLCWLDSIGESFAHSSLIVDRVAAKGLTRILDWFRYSKRPFKYSKSAINNAATHGHLAVLDWFKQSNYLFKYSTTAIDEAATRGQLAVLQWFLDNHYPLKYTTKAIIGAVKNNHLLVLIWFKLNGYLCYCEGAVYWATVKGHLHILNWYLTNDYFFNNYEQLMDVASENHQLPTFYWLKAHLGD